MAHFSINVTHDKPSLACTIPLCLRDENPLGFIETLHLLSVIAIMLSIGAVLINGVFILIIYLYQELRSTSNYLFLNLAIVNITFGTVSLITVCVYYQAFIDCAPVICVYRDIFAFCVGVDMALTMTTFSVICIERYICIFYALRWTEIITNRRVAIVVVSLWILWIGIGSVCRVLDKWPLFKSLYMIQAFVNAAVMVTTNVMIFKEIRRHEKRIDQEQVAPNAEEIRRAREKKRTKAVTLMIVLVLLCYFPTVVLLMAGKQIPLTSQFQWKFAWLPFRIILLSHTTFDIIVYGLRIEETRRAFKKVFKRLWCL